MMTRPALVPPGSGARRIPLPQLSPRPWSARPTLVCLFAARQLPRPAHHTSSSTGTQRRPFTSTPPLRGHRADLASAIARQGGDMGSAGGVVVVDDGSLPPSTPDADLLGGPAKWQSGMRLRVDPSTKTISTAAGPLPVSPLMDTDWHAARARWRGPKRRVLHWRDGKPPGTFRQILHHNPFARALLTPVRLDPVTGARLPAFFLENFRLMRHPVTGDAWWAPRELLQRREQSRARHLREEQQQLRRLKAGGTGTTATEDNDDDDGQIERGDLAAATDDVAATTDSAADHHHRNTVATIPGGPSRWTVLSHATMSWTLGRPQQRAAARAQERAARDASRAVPRLSGVAPVPVLAAGGAGSFLGSSGTGVGRFKNAYADPRWEQTLRRSVLREDMADVVLAMMRQDVADHLLHLARVYDLWTTKKAAREEAGKAGVEAAAAQAGEGVVEGEQPHDDAEAKEADGLEVSLASDGPAAGPYKFSEGIMVPVADENWEEMARRLRRGCILWLGLPSSGGGGGGGVPPSEAEASSSPEQVEAAAADSQGGPGPYTTLDLEGRKYFGKMAVHNLARLLGADELARLRRGNALFGDSTLIGVHTPRTVPLQLKLWKLEGFLADSAV